MKNSTTILYMAVCLLISSVSFASDQQAQETALLSFQPIVAEVTNFFANNPKLLVKISPPENPNQIAYFTTHFSYRQSGYDIVKSNSIVTPYRSFIDIDTDVFDNKPCGNISFDNSEMDGWINAEAAIQLSNKQSCYVSRTNASGPIRHRFAFAYQTLDKRWALTEIIYQNGQPNGRFLALLDIPTPWFPVNIDPQAQGFNRAWYDLFKRLR